MFPFLPFALALAHRRPRHRFGADLDDAVGGDLDDAFGADGVGRPLLRRRCSFPPGMVMPAQVVPTSQIGWDVGYDANELGADDIDELAAIDDAIVQLDAEDDEDIGADGAEDIGATVKKLGRKEDRIERVIERLEAKLADTPPSKPKKRERLKMRLATLRGKLQTTKAKRKIKEQRVAAVYGQPPRGLKDRAADNIARQRAEAEAGTLRLGDFRQVTGIRTMIHLTDAADAEQEPSVQFGAGAGRRATTVEWASPQISYERLRVIGLHFEFLVSSLTVGGAATGDVWPFFQLSSVQRDGGLDLVTQTVAIPLKSEVCNTIGMVRLSGEWYGGREAILLDKRDTLSVTGSVIQARDNANAVNWSCSCDMIADILSDDQGG